MAGHLYALLVGIDKYKKGFNLSGCVNDITAVKEFLDERLNKDTFSDSKLRLLTNEDATRDAIIKGFTNHLSDARKGDTVLFYFCGHGAREKAGKEFKDWELDNAHETIVCHDSRTEIDGKIVPDLADKELRYLISQIANKGENSPDHVLVVFDCCHSSSGTRDLEDADGVRQLDDTAPARKYSDFYFADPIPSKALSPETFPQGEHTFIAACLNTETAKEVRIFEENTKQSSIKRGLFTYSLIKELESQNAALSYKNLIDEVRTRVTGFRLYQNPQLEFVEGFNQENLSRLRLEKLEIKALKFLGNAASIKPRDPFFKLNYRPHVHATSSGDPEQQAAWIIRAGAFQGLQKGMELVVYPENSEYKDIKIPASENDSESKPIKDGSVEKIARASIIEVRATESVVNLEEVCSDELKQDYFNKEFPAIVIKRPIPEISFYFEGEKETDRQLLEKVRKVLLENWGSLSVGVVIDPSQPHQYRLYIRNQQFQITDIDKRGLIEPFPAEDNDDSIAFAASQVEHIAKWVTTRDLENPNSSIDRDKIKIEITYEGVLCQESHLTLSYQSKKPRIQIKIKNESDKDLFFTLLDIGNDYSIEPASILYDGENKADAGWIPIQQGKSYVAKYRSSPQKELDENIPFGIPSGDRYDKLTKYGSTLKLIASTHQFSVEQFNLGPLPFLSDSVRGAIGEEEQIPPPIGDWVTKKFEFTYIRPKASVLINPGDPANKLSEDISIRLPDGFSANVSLKPVSTASGERSLGSDIELPLLKGAEAFDLIDRRSGNRSISQIPGQQLSVLELSGSNLASDRVTPKSPIIISSDRALELDEGVLALAHDGDFWLPVGYAMPEETNKTRIEIQHLVTRKSDNLQDGDRNVVEAMSLCFLKVALKSAQTAWLRQAIFDSDGKVSFTPKGDVDSVGKAVAHAERIVLFIHGIFGDTESMIPSIQATGLLNSDDNQEPGKYDLVLAFDYESLTTEIQETANILKQKLSEVGLGEGHHKVLHIIAHSMGGLVSRSFIEQQNGSKVVKHLIMLGTPNGGSEWSSVYELATLLLSVGLNFIPKSFVAGPIVSLLAKKGIEKMSTTLKQMNIQESKFLPELRKSQDPHCPYTIIAGDTQLNQELNTKAENLLAALKQKVWKQLEFPFQNQKNDIAVTVAKIFTEQAFEARDPQVNFMDSVACNHLTYFVDDNGLNALSRAVRHAFNLPDDLEDEPAKQKLIESDGLMEKKHDTRSDSASLTQPLTQQQEVSVSADTGSATTSPPPPPETRTTSWFDTTHLIAIGIDDYKHGVPPLGKAVSDAIKVAEIFHALKPTEKVEYYFSLAPKTNSGYEEEPTVLKLSHNRQPYLPTREGFNSLLTDLEQTVGKNDRIILYFAGHGIALPFARKEVSNNKDGQLQVTLDDKPQGFLLLEDAENRQRETYLKMDDLIERLKKINCRHGLIVLDCCFAGAVEWSLYRGVRGQIGDDLVTPSVLDRYITKNAWQILTSSSENQVTNEALSPEEKLEQSSRADDKNSPFVGCLEKALIDGAADDLQANGERRGFIHATRLMDYLRKEVQDKLDRDNKTQTPCLFPFPLKHEQAAEFVFLLNGKNLDDIKKGLPKDPDINEVENPYRGLDSYDTEHYDMFFGRDRLIKDLFECMSKNRKNGFPLTVVSGASGSGKSSLVKAGLVDKIFPSEVKEYKKRIEEEKKKIESKVETEEYKKKIKDHYPWQIVRPGRLPGNSLQEARKKLLSSSIPDGKNYLLVIDQFEEVETQCETIEQKESFWKELFELLVDEQKKVDVILTLRSDFETTLRNQFETALAKLPKSALNKLPEIKETKASEHWVSARFPVHFIEREALEKVIIKPAEKSIVFFDDRKNSDDRTLVEQLIHEVTGMPGALPLLSVALNSMYESFKKRYVESLKKLENKPEKREITWKDYEGLEKGGVTGAIRKKATELYKGLSPEEQRVLRWVMMRMITRKGNQPPVRKQVMQTELIYPNKEHNTHRKKVIDRFIEGRLLVSGGEGEDIYYEPAHDALVREWDYIATWLEGKKEPDNSETQAGSPEKAPPEKSSIQEQPPESGFPERLLAGLRNLFSLFGKNTNQELQPFDLILLQEVNAAANTWKKIESQIAVESEPSNTDSELKSKTTDTKSS